MKKKRRTAAFKRALCAFSLLVACSLVMADVWAHREKPQSQVGLQTAHDSNPVEAQPSPSAKPVQKPPAGDSGAQGDGDDSSDEEEPFTVVEQGTGTFLFAEGGTQVMGTSSSVLRYQVQVEAEINFPADEFARSVDATLGDSRSWIGGGEVSFQRVDEEGAADFVVYLASPKTVDRLCYPLQTNGYVSCRQGDAVVINLARWIEAVPHYDGQRDAYRSYVINHEVGHRLGYGHESCPGSGQPAPIMMQQTYSLGECSPNSWVYLDSQSARHSGPPVT